jgi:hypothetical protein
MTEHIFRLVMGFSLFLVAIGNFLGVETIHFTLGAICIALLWLVCP